MTMYDRRLGLTGEVMGLLAKRFGDSMFATQVRVNSHLKSAPAHRQDIFQFESKTKKPWKGTQDFSALADEVLARLKKKSVRAA